MFFQGFRDPVELGSLAKNVELNFHSPDLWSLQVLKGRSWGKEVSLGSLHPSYLCDFQIGNVQKPKKAAEICYSCPHPQDL